MQNIPGVQMNKKNVIGESSDLVCVDPRADVELITGVQMSIEYLVGDMSEMIPSIHMCNQARHVVG